jgi:enamine deaminase RidA (YjgF/YER057c/UK114 family)
VNQEIAPASIAPPAANYAHAMLTECKGTWLHTSGVVPIRPDRSVPDSVEEQADVVWANIAAILEDAQMVPADIVSVTTYVVVEHLASLPWIMQARDRALLGHRVASTLVTVPALANPSWKLEIAIIASR